MRRWRSLVPGLLWLGASFIAGTSAADSKGSGGSGSGSGGNGNGNGNGSGSSSSGSGTVWATPHEQFSSSAGVLGCKIDTNRVAYWPGSVDCDNVCVSLRYEGRSVLLLRIDTSEGAHDISYDAWNYLYTGYKASARPVTGGPVAMEYEYVDPARCADLMLTDDHRLPFSAPTGTGLLVSCLSNRPNSWVARNHVLYNLVDAICTWSPDETCTLDYPAANQASCPHTLGAPVRLNSTPVYNIQYGTGDKVLASTGQIVQFGGGSGGSSGSGGSGGSSGSGSSGSSGSSGNSGDNGYGGFGSYSGGGSYNGGSVGGNGGSDGGSNGGGDSGGSGSGSGSGDGGGGGGDDESGGSLPLNRAIPDIFWLWSLLGLAAVLQSSFM